MKKFTQILAAAACSLPLAVLAQTSTGVQSADTPRNGIEKDATQNKGQATKYGSQTDSANGQADTSTSSMSKSSKHSMTKHDKSSSGSSMSDGSMTNKEKGSASNGGTTEPAPVTPTGKDGTMHK